METFVLIVRLMAGGPVETIPVRDCSAIDPWIHAAWDWADRSGMPIDIEKGGPIVICVPVDMALPAIVTVRTAGVSR